MPSATTRSVTTTRSGWWTAPHAGHVSIPEVVEAAIARAEKVDPALEALAFRAFDRARVEARNPRGGFFAGVPTVVKDNVDVAGMPTQDGTDAWEPRPATADGDFARMYLATGPDAAGQDPALRVRLLARPASTRAWGRCASPWSPDHTAGASSAGSAALVAAGALPIAHANDGGGSIRIPAVGQRPGRAQAHARPARPGHA